MAFQLAHVINLAEGAFVGQLLRPHVLRCETEVLAVHQDHAGPAAFLDHPLALRRVQRHRLVDEHMLARGGRGKRHLAMQVIRTRDRNGIHEPAVQHVLVVLEHVRNLETPVKFPGVLRVRRCRRHQLRPRRLPQAESVQVRCKSRPHDAHADGHASSFRITGLASVPPTRTNPTRSNTDAIPSNPW